MNARLENGWDRGFWDQAGGGAEASRGGGDGDRAAPGRHVSGPPGPAEDGASVGGAAGGWGGPRAGGRAGSFRPRDFRLDFFVTTAAIHM